MDQTELAVIGLTCNVVGVFFLANSIILRRARRVLEEFFGVGRGSLDLVKDYSLHKIQVVIGFLFLTAGLLVQAWGALAAAENRGPVLLICLAIAGFALGVYLVGSFYSRARFNRLLQEFFQTHPWSFTENMTLTKEIGLLLGIRHTNDMTVEEFVFQVKKALGVPNKQPDALPGLGQERGRRLRVPS